MAVLALDGLARSTTLLNSVATATRNVTTYNQNAQLPGNA
jgi:hypothetical protein